MDYKESWAPKNWCFWTVVLEKTLDSSLACKKIQPVHPKGDQSWVFFGWTEVEAEIPILWLPHVKSWLIWKDPDAGKDWSQEEKGMASLTQWMRVWLSSGSWWWSVRPGVLCSMRSQRVRNDWATELNWIDRVSPSLGAKNVISLILILSSWWCPFLDHFLSCWKRVFAIPCMFSWQNSVSLCSPSLCTPRSNFPIIYYLCLMIFYLCIPIPYNEKDITFLCQF